MFSAFVDDVIDDVPMDQAAQHPDCDMISQSTRYWRRNLCAVSHATNNIDADRIRMVSRRSTRRAIFGTVPHQSSPVQVSNLTALGGRRVRADPSPRHILAPVSDDTNLSWW